jgi:glycosyltransferase involved in cell wall biosynthesis
MSSGLVSVIVPTYNNARYIVECVDSIESQTYKNIEIIIVDDGSTDNTTEVVSELSKKYENIIYKRIENSKSPTARNVGFHLAKGEYIAAVDSDDLWPPTKIEEQVTLLRAKPGSIVLGGAQNFFVDERGNKIFGEIISLPIVADDSDYLDQVMMLRLNQMVLFNTFLTEREIILNDGLWNPKFVTAHDWEDWVRLAKKYSFIHVDKIFQFYRKHTTSTTRRHKKFQALNYQLQVIDLHAKTGHWSTYSSLRYRRVRYESWIRIYAYEKQFNETFSILFRSFVDSSMLFSLAGIKLSAECVMNWLKHAIKGGS